MNTLKEDEVKRTIQEAENRLRDLAFDFFSFQPLNKTIIDPYNDLVINTIPEILDAPIFFESKDRVGILEFKNVRAMPPFSGVIKPFSDDEHLKELKNRHTTEIEDLERSYAFSDGSYDATLLESPEFLSELAKLKNVHNMERHNFFLSRLSSVPKDNWLTAAKARQSGESYLLSIYCELQKTEWTKTSEETFFPEDQTKEEEDLKYNYILDSKMLSKKLLDRSDLLTMTKTVQTSESPVLLFKIPLMLGSAWDWLILSKIGKEDWNQYGECNLSPQCQFIIRGNEKAFVSQIKASHNEPRVFLDKKGSDDIPEKVCELRCSTISKKSNLIKLKFIATSKKTDIQGVKICFMTMPFMKDEQQVRGSTAKPHLTFNVLWIFRFYAIWYFRMKHPQHIELQQGESNKLMLQEFNRTLMDVCYQESKGGEISLYRQVVNELIDTIEHSTKYDEVDIRSDEDFIIHMRSYATKEQAGDMDHNLNYMKYRIDMQFMPQIICEEYSYNDPQNWRPYPKFVTLVQMLVKYIKCYVGVKPVDDRDSLEEQQLATAGMEIGVLIKKAFNTVKAFAKKELSKSSLSVDRVGDQLLSWGDTKVTNQIISSFSTGNWGLDGGGPRRPGVVQMFETASLASQWHMVRKTSIPANKNSNIKKARQVHHTSYGIYDPTNTPESQAVGLTRSLCLSVYVTSEDVDSRVRIMDVLKTRIDDNKGAYRTRKPFQGEDTSERFPVYIDNIFFCYANEEVYNEIKTMKIRGQIGYSEVYIRTMIDVWETVKEIRIRTGAGRTMRPLLRIENNAILALEAIRRGEKLSFSDILINGLAEYVSPGEFQEAEVAVNYSHFIKGLRIGRKFTHIELDPYMAMSIEVATQPYPQLNPNPRVLYYAGMIRQPLSVPFATYQTRQETEIRVLNYVHKPLITSDIVKVLGLDKQPFGTMVYVVIKSKSQTDEDATVWKKSFFDRGGMQGTIYNTYTVEAANTVADPRDPVNSYSKGLIKIRYPSKESEKEEDGDEIKITADENSEEETEWPFEGDIPRLKGSTNVVVKPNDILVRYRVKQDETSDIGKLKLAGKRTGFVTFTDISGSGSQKEQRIVVRFPHIPREGDKFANRYAQKGVVGSVINDVDMPYVITPGGAITPDVIFSPTSLTSRMTVGMNAEIWAGQAVVACDTRRFVKNLVRWVMGMEAPELVDPNKDFWIALTNAMVSSEDPNSPSKPKGVDSFQLGSKMSDERKLNLMDEGWEEKWGILVSKNVGENYFAVPDDDSVSVLSPSDEKVVLFSQLSPELAELWFMENKERIVPSYMFRNPQLFSQEEIEELKDATAFRDPNYNTIYNSLKERGYSPKGTYPMIDGKSGAMSRATLFVGPCMWMQLRHLTESKYQFRDQGSMSIASRSVAKGKAVGGAVRSGELSHSAMLAHGNMAYLTERFMLASDKYEALICKTCGGECYKQANSAVIKCETCGSTDIPRILTLPYSGVRFMSLLTSAGVRPYMETAEDPRYKHNVIGSTIFESKPGGNAPKPFII